MSKSKKEEQLIEETKNATEKLDMWATAMGLSSDDVKKLKIGAIQDLVEEANGAEDKKIAEESDTEKLIEKMRSGEFGFSTPPGSCLSSNPYCNTLSSMFPYLMMLNALHSYPTTQPITVHVHIDK